MVTSLETETSQSLATLDACDAKSAGVTLCVKFLSKFARGIHPGVKFKETEPEPLQMSWETLTFNSSSAIAPLPLRTTCLSLKKESSLERRRKAESDIFFLHPPKNRKIEKIFAAVLPFPKKKEQNC